MSIKDLLETVDDRIEIGKLAIDSDSCIFKACHRYKDNWNIELAYMDFMFQIGTIQNKCYQRLAKIEEIKICLTSSTNFRYDIYPEYKANRKKIVDKDALQLKERVKELKKVIYQRVKSLVLVGSVWEADDYMIQLSEKGWILAAIDKDVINASRTSCYDYNKSEWIDGKDIADIAEWYLIQAITGDSTDGIPGVKGVGKVGASKFIQEIKDGTKEFSDYVDLFPTPEDCLLMNRLVRMNQHDSDGNLKLCTINDINDDIEMLSVF